MAKKKTILWGRVFAFVGIILTAFVVFLVSTNSLPSTTSLRSMVKPKAAVTKSLNVLEIRYFPSDPNGTQLSKTNALSSLLVTDIGVASKPHGYKDANATAVLQPVIKRVITRAKSSPYTTGTGETWYESAKTLLTGDGEDLCAYIVANNIDQVWFWKDVGVDNGGFDQERFLSWSNTMLPSGGYPPLCNGQRTFLILGLDQNRTVGQALESFAHSIEDTAPVLMSSDLFWTRFTGGSSGAVEARTCGNVHFPPNTSLAYDYTRGTGISTNCEDWHPDGTGTYTNVTCARWGCTEEGYQIWWIQNLPHSSYGLLYNGKVIPTYTEFLADTDNAIRNAAASNQWLTPQYAAKATPGPTATPTGTPLVSFFSSSYVCRNPANTTDTTCAGCTQLCYDASACQSGLQCYAITPQNQPINVGTINTVTLVNRPTSATATYFMLDGIILNGVTMQETDTNLKYSGTWTSAASASYSGGASKYSITNGNFVQFSTNATSVKVLGLKNTATGSFDVYVNGAYKGTVAMTNASTLYQQQMDITPFLTSAAVTRRTVKFQFHLYTSGQDMAIDYIKDGTTIIDDTSPLISYAGTWTKGTSASPYGGTYAATVLNGSSMSYVTGAKTLIVRPYRFSSRGGLDVYVNGVLKQQINDLPAGSGWSDVAVTVY